MTEQEIREMIIENIELYIDDYSIQAVDKTAKALHQKFKDELAKLSLKTWGMEMDDYNKALIYSEEKGYNKGVMETHAAFTKLKKERE